MVYLIICLILSLWVNYVLIGYTLYWKLEPEYRVLHRGNEPDLDFIIWRILGWPFVLYNLYKNEELWRI